MSAREFRIVLAVFILVFAVVLAVMGPFISDADLSQVGRRGGPDHKGARLAEAAYRAGGRTGVLVLCWGMSGILLVASIRTLIRELGTKRRTDGASQGGPTAGQRSGEHAVCACCNADIWGTRMTIPDDQVSLPNDVGYICRSCNAMICERCAENRIGRSLWTGWDKKRCPICGGLFAPRIVIVGS